MRAASTYRAARRNAGRGKAHIAMRAWRKARGLTRRQADRRAAHHLLQAEMGTFS